LMAGVSRDEGRLYNKSVYGEAPSEIIYSVPAGCTTFVSAVGLGNNSARSSVVFQVYVDGVKKYDSELYKLGAPVLPVVVDVKGAKELKLVVGDAGDGYYDDYSWWGEARLVKE